MSGRVQGVNYRNSARYKANQLGLTGWIRNLQDGRVEAVVAGDNEAVYKFVRWCRSGPPRSWVKDVEVIREDAKGEFQKFRVLH
ncbi:MAG: acylphosphatase [Candidatus Bathyarchaeia archaeon]